MGSTSVLVNNAGVLLDESASLLEADEAMFHLTLETNTLGPWRVSRAFWPLLRKPGGRVINISSGGGQLSQPSGWSPAYCVSKTALNGVTVQLALEAARSGMAVNAVCPGWVRTDMGGPSAERSPEQAADTPVWLALEAPLSVNGQYLRDRQPIAW